LLRNPQNVGGSINENTWQHLMFARVRLANLTIPELEQSRAGVLNTLASARLHGLISLCFVTICFRIGPWLEKIGSKRGRRGK
jgi:hypothetical protein